jgi:CHAT domain-containing protein
MEQFYHHLASSPPEIALAKTQRYFISQQSSQNIPAITLLAHPYVWGAYMVVGMP